MAMDIRTKKDYEEYENNVKEFFESEGITNLSTGHLTCQECDYDGDDFTDEQHCPECGASREAMDEPYFSWRACECCGGMLGGDRYHATGWNPETKEIQEYEVCSNCVYYAEYGQLDDMTMMDMKEDEEE